MFVNAVANLTNVSRMKGESKPLYLICIMHITGVSLRLLSASPCPISLLSFKFGVIVHIRPAFCGNVNTNAGEYFQTVYDHLLTSNDHFKCIAITKNGLRLLTNMFSICFSCEY